MRHSLFFQNFEDADKAEARVSTLIAGVVDTFQSNDGETGAIEVRFFTNVNLSDFTQRHLLRVTRPDTYALNCEDY